MLKIDLPWILPVIEAIDSLSDVKSDQTVRKNWFSLFNSQQQIKTLFGQSVYSPYLRTSREKADGLLSQIGSILGDGSDMDRQLNEYEVWSLIQKRDHLRLVFLSELSTLPVFLVAPKEGYDINILIDYGTTLFPRSLVAKVPETHADSMEAGKALAFELGTACGFHVFRVTESVLKRYWTVVSNNAPSPKLETIGNYATALQEKSYGDQKVSESLKQLAKLHRNPLIHPDVILTVEEAIGIVGMARSVIGAMLSVLPDAVPTTGA